MYRDIRFLRARTSIKAALLLITLGVSNTTVSTAVSQERADLVFFGGRIATMNAKQPQATAIAVQGDRILRVGDDASIKKLVVPGTKQIDLKGKFVMPGFIEGHAHFVGLGQSKMMLDLSTADSWEAIISQVLIAARSTPKGQWIVGRGWHQSKWKQAPTPNIEGYPVHDALSKISPDHPVLLTHASGHASFANALAMKQAGVTAATKPPPGGEILKSADGSPTGVFRETASGLISRAYQRALRRQTPQQRQATLLKAIELAGEECLKHGITTFQDAGSSFGLIDAFRELASTQKLPVRLWVMIRESNGALRARARAYRLVDPKQTFLTVRAIKRSLDGALGPHGAWLLQPYEDLPQSVGLNTYSLQALRETAAIAKELEFQLCVHAIGDRANRETLDIFENALKPAEQASRFRWRVEHAQHLHRDDIPRFGQLGIIASMQGVHCTSDAIFVVERLGQRRAAEGAYAWRSLLDSGAVVINGTDAPVERVNPLPSVYASVTRKFRKDMAFFPKQSMTREEALKSYTIDAAFAGFLEKDRGSLEPGKLADMVVLSRNLLTCEEEQILSTKVLMTVLGGKLVYED